MGILCPFPPLLFLLILLQQLIHHHHLHLYGHVFFCCEHEVVALVSALNLQSEQIQRGKTAGQRLQRLQTGI